MKDLGYYKLIRNKVKSGDMLEFRSNGFTGRAIRFFSKQNVNHTALAVALDEYMDYREPHKFLLEADAPGIVLKLISKELTGYGGQVWWTPLKAKYDALRGDIARWSMLQIGTKYDTKSLFKNILGRVNADAKKLFCSEFYFLALKEVGILHGKKAPRPGEFQKYGVHEPAVKIYG